MEKNTKSKIAGAFKKYGILFVLAALVIVSGILSPYFFKSQNILNVLRQISVVAIITCAETMLIIAGYIDLSVGAIIALTGCISASIGANMNNPYLAVVVAMAVGAVCGLLSGSMVAFFNVPAFISTLAVMTICKGAVLLYTDGFSIYNIGDMAKLGQGKIGFLPIPVFAMIIVIAISWILLERTKYGRSLFAIGGNRKAAVASGINDKAITMKVYLYTGILAGLAGVILAARLNAGMPTAGDGYEMDAISAAVVGGTSFSGGSGSIFGSLIGALIIGVLNNLLNLLGVGSSYQQIVRGIIIAVAVILDLMSKKGGIKSMKKNKKVVAEKAV